MPFRQTHGSFHKISGTETVNRMGLVLGQSFAQSKLEIDQSVNESTGSENPETTVEIKYAGRLIGEFSTSKVRKTMTFDIRMAPGFAHRKLRLYAEWLSAALNANPEVRYVPAEMQESNSQNAVAFFSSFLGKRPEDLNSIMIEPQLQLQKWRELSREECQVRRRSILESYQVMPSTKARQAAGVGKVHFIRLTLSSIPDFRGIGFLAEKGEFQANSDPVRIFLDFDESPEVLWELKEDGVFEISRIRDLGVEYPPWNDYKILRY